MKFIPYEKMSKKERHALDLQQRNTWGGLCPVTRTSVNRKRYCRAKVKREARCWAAG